MSGRIDPSLLSLVFLTSLSAAAFDIARSKIPNFITFSALLLGVLLGALRGGWLGLSEALLGGILPFLLTFWMYFFRWLGAGDIKLYMALGALGGWHYGVEVVLVSLLIGGIIAFFVLTVRGRLIPFFKQIYRFVLTRWVKDLEPEPLLRGPTHTFPFAIPIGLAAIWCSVGQPLQAIGWRLW
jgi:Flp pilus assembly protein protease CpaA